MQISTHHLEKLHSYKETLVTSAVILTCLFLSILFQADNTLQSISRSIFFLIILPVLYIKFILKNDLADWGWNLENKKEGAVLASISLCLALIIFYLLIRWAGFSSHYHVNTLIQYNFWLFLLYELFFLNIFFFAQEFFFKGFVLSAFRQFSFWTILIQSGLYFALFILSKTFSWQTSPFMFISLVGGLIAYKTRSFFYSYIFGLSFIIILDAYIIHLVK